MSEETKEAAKSEEKSKLETRWAVFSAVGSFVLYLFGYLTLRFHLSSFGVDTDLAVLDERYLFAGAQFLVYFLCSIPIVLLFALPVFMIFRRRIRALRQRCQSAPNRPLFGGIVVSVWLIQFVIRKCLPFTDLLLSHQLPDYPLMKYLLLEEGDGLRSLYFSGLVAVILAMGVLLYYVSQPTVGASVFWRGLLALLIGIQFLLLPVTFGVLIADQDSPRVTTLDGKQPLKPGEEAWRIWEGASSTTFFVRTWQGDSRRLVTLENKKIEKTEIVGYDRILRLLPW